MAQALTRSVLQRGWFSVIFSVLLVTAVGLSLSHFAQAQTQTLNILGLPAVLQRPASAPLPPAATPALNAAQATAAKSAASAASRPVAAEQVRDAGVKSVLSGNVKLASTFAGNLMTVRMITANTYAGELRSKALQAGRLVQRDVRTACAKLCKPAAMPAPQLLPDGTLQVDMVVDGYGGQISIADMVNMMMGKRIGPPMAVSVTSPAAVLAKPSPPPPLLPPEPPAAPTTPSPTNTAADANPALMPALPPASTP